MAAAWAVGVVEVGTAMAAAASRLVVGAMAMAAAASWLVVVAAAMLWPRRRSRGEGAHPLQPLPRPQAETGGVIRQRPSVRPRDGKFVSLRCNDVRGKILRKRGE